MTLSLPVLTADQMRTVDHLMVERYGIQLIQMMENAGRNLAELTLQMNSGQLEGKRIAVLCGPGNNGGGGMVAARHLHNWGATVAAVLVDDEAKMKEVPRLQWAILERIGIAVRNDILESRNLIVDAMLGYGVAGDPRPPIAAWVERANASGVQILALDTPSGLDTTTGVPGSPTIRATATLTLALPKIGLLQPAARSQVGKLYLADIGVPPELYALPPLNLRVPALFSKNTIIELDGDTGQTR